MLGMLYVKKDLSRDRSNHRVLEKKSKKTKRLTIALESDKKNC